MATMIDADRDGISILGKPASYDEAIDSLRDREFPMLRGTTYLDHASTTLFPKSLVDEFSKAMISNVLGNPHSTSASSQTSSRWIEDVRLKVLRFFDADPDQFDLIFVANATAGIKMVMEAFREHKNGFWYGYHKDAHTSLVGVREAALAGHHCFGTDLEVEKWLSGQCVVDKLAKNTGLGLFAYPAQSNFNGRRLPLSWPGRVRSSRLAENHQMYTLLDAAALVSTSSLDLSNVSQAPDYTVLSFYKIFGFPDLGALIVRKDSGRPLECRKYFGGGTVEMVTCVLEHWHIKKHSSLHAQLEDGTLPVHSIIALDCALNAYNRLFGSPEAVSAYTSSLAKHFYDRLDALRHGKGLKVCYIYKDPSSDYNDSRTQGPIIAFNLQNSLGAWVSNSEIEKLAVVKNIHLRSGGLCNPGGIASSLQLAPWEMKRNFLAGQRCGNENDIIGGKPTGAVRVSLGAMSSLQDVTTFVEFLEEFFVDNENAKEPVKGVVTPYGNFYVETLTIYPIKSCGGWSIPFDTFWDIKPEGLALDREWCLVHQGTRAALSQKQHPRMALLKPSIDVNSGLLCVRYHGIIPPSTPTEITVPLSADPTMFQHHGSDCKAPSSQICGDTIVAHTYASKEIADFFTNIIGTPCTLARFPADPSDQTTRHSKAHLQPPQESTSRIQIDLDASPLQKKKRPILLSNESPILAISRSSLNALNAQIALTAGKPAQASVFRANIVLAESPTNGSTSPLAQEHPYIEDTWHRMLIGNDKFKIWGGCRRCQMVCVDQKSAVRDKEPFVTLAKTRRERDGRVVFGVHCCFIGGGNGRIRVGETVVPVGKEEHGEGNLA